MKKIFVLMVILSFLVFAGSVLAEDALPSPKNATRLAALHNDEGVRHFITGHWDVAIGHFKEAVDADPEFAVGYYNLGLGWHKKGNHKKATDFFRKAAKLAPNNNDIQNSKVLRGHIGS